MPSTAAPLLPSSPAVARNVGATDSRSPIAAGASRADKRTGLLGTLALLFLGALFMGVVLFFPDGILGFAARLLTNLQRWRRREPAPLFPSPPTPGPGLADPATK